MSIQLYKHNQETYDNVVNMFEEGNRVGVVQPTGTGKSFLYLKWIEDNPNDKICVFSPSNEIFNQLDRYATENGDSALLRNVEYITYQSLLAMTNEELIALNPDKIIIDEFHRTGAEQWGTRVQQILEAFPSSLVLGGTATPVRYLDGARDMADEIFEKKLARYMTLGEAVAKEILPMPNYIPVYYDVDGSVEMQQQRVADAFNDPNERKAYEEKVNALKQQLENSYGAEKMFQENMPTNHGKYIVFCRNNEHLENMKGVMKDWLKNVNGNVHMYKSVAGQDDDNKELYSFIGDNSANAVKLLFTIDRFNEGVHVPGIDGVIMLRPTTSPIIYLQQMGRALAVGKHNQPLVFDLVNNFENVKVMDKEGNTQNAFEREFREHASSSQVRKFEKFGLLKRELDFNSLVSQLEDVLSYDNETRWQQQFEICKKHILEKGRLPKTYEVYSGIKIGRWLEKQRCNFNAGKLMLHRAELLRSIGVNFEISRQEQQWQQKFEICKEFVLKHGCLPKQNEVYCGVNIGAWIDTQKHAFHVGKLTSQRAELLHSIGVNFEMTRQEQQWQQKFEICKEFVLKHGCLPKQNEVYCGVNIGRWVSTQKCDFHAGKLTSQRAELLHSIGVNLNISQHEQWQQKFEICKEFVLKHGCLPKQNEVYCGVKIGQWVGTQRRDFHAGKLAPYRAKLLCSIGVNLNISQHEQQWQEKFEVCKEFVLKYGRLPKCDEVYSGVKIAQWVHAQRRDFNAGKLMPHRADLLCSIGVNLEVSQTPAQKIDTVDGFLASALSRSKEPSNAHNSSKVNVLNKTDDGLGL